MRASEIFALPLLAADILKGCFGPPLLRFSELVATVHRVSDRAKSVDHGLFAGGGRSSASLQLAKLARLSSKLGKIQVV
eukprot:IDg21330t1